MARMGPEGDAVDGMRRGVYVRESLGIQLGARTLKITVYRFGLPLLGALGVVTHLAALTGCSRDNPSAEPSRSGDASSLATAASVPPAAVPTPTTVSSPRVNASVSTPPPALAPIHVPTTVTDKRPYVIFLHGLGASSAILSDRLALGALAAERKFSWSAPDGDLNSKGQRFWNASKACCNFDGSLVSHVDRIRSMVIAASTHPKIDASKIYVVGFSNGGFMAHRLACEVDGIAGIVSVAGAGPAEGESCTPAHPVSVLQIHGDADDTIKYEGGSALGRSTLPRHSSARETVEGWGTRNGCKGKLVGAGTLDIEDKLEGAETTVTRFSGCTRPVELWTVRGGSHFVAMGHRAQEALLTFLEKSSLP
jgi:polyhydroxybutyrate depolymerase